MSDRNSPEAWLQGWQALQQQFAKTWQDAAAGSGSKAPLDEGFAMWSRMAGGGQSGNQALDRAVGAARQFVGMMQSVINQGAGAQGMGANDWSNALGAALGGLDPAHNPIAEALRQAAGEGSRGFEQLFAEFSQGAQPFKDGMDSMLNLPAFGYSRERQERKQAMARAWADYSTQMDRYNKLMLEASRKALERMELKLSEHSEPGRQLKSFREVYDTWIDAAEEGYAEVALSTEFRKAYGALVNAQMKVRQLVQQEIERHTASVGMPTRTEVDAVHRKLAELKRRIATLEDAGGTDDPDPVAAVASGVVVRPVPRSARARPMKKAKAASASGKTGKWRKLRIVGGTDVPKSAAPSAKSTGKSAKSKSAPTKAKSKKPESARAPSKPTRSGPPPKSGNSFADRLAQTRKTGRNGRKGDR